MFNLKLGRMK
jgi:hypothetical protein